MRCVMWSLAPVKKLSTQMTSWPLPSRRSQRCEPRKPAPPVTKVRGLKNISGYSSMWVTGGRGVAVERTSELSRRPEEPLDARVVFGRADVDESSGRPKRKRSDAAHSGHKQVAFEGKRSAGPKACTQLRPHDIGSGVDPSGP